MRQGGTVSSVAWLSGSMYISAVWNEEAGRVPSLALWAVRCLWLAVACRAVCSWIGQLLALFQRVRLSASV